MRESLTPFANGAMLASTSVAGSAGSLIVRFVMRFGWATLVNRPHSLREISGCPERLSIDVHDSSSNRQEIRSRKDRHPAIKHHRHLLLKLTPQAAGRHKAMSERRQLPLNLTASAEVLLYGHKSLAFKFTR